MMRSERRLLAEVLVEYLVQRYDKYDLTGVGIVNWLNNIKQVLHTSKLVYFITESFP